MRRPVGAFRDEGSENRMSSVHTGDGKSCRGVDGGGRKGRGRKSGISASNGRCSQHQYWESLSCATCRQSGVPGVSSSLEKHAVGCSSDRCALVLNAED